MIEIGLTEKIQLFTELDGRLLADEKPSVYIKQKMADPLLLAFPFQIFGELAATPQSPKFHSEGNVLIHTMMVVDEAAKVREKSSWPRGFMWGALLHDIGKPAATKIRDGRITSCGHDVAGKEIARSFLGEFSADKNFIHYVSGLVRWHMQAGFLTNLNPNEMKKNIEAMGRETNVKDVGLLGYCDRMGRGGSDKKETERRLKIFFHQFGLPFNGVDDL